MPRAVRQAILENEASGWAAAAIWSDAVANSSSSLNLGALVGPRGAGATLHELIVAPAYLNEWAFLSGLSEQHPFGQTLARLTKTHASLTAMRVKWAQLLAADPSTGSTRDGGAPRKAQASPRAFSRQLESFGWCVFAHVSARLESVLSDQPEMLRWYCILVGVLRTLLDVLPPSSPGGGVSAEQKQSLVARVCSDPQVQPEQIDRVTAAVRMECLQLFQSLPASGDELLSESNLPSNLEALLSLPIEGTKQQQDPLVHIDARWYATDELVLGMIGDPKLKRDVEEAGRSSSEGDLRHAEQPSPSVQRVGATSAAAGQAPMSPEQREQRESTLAAETLAHWGIVEQQKIQPAPTLARRPPGTPVSAAIRDSQWMTQLTMLVPDQVAEMVDLSAMCATCQCELVSLTTRVDEMAGSIVQAAAIPPAVSQRLPVVAKLYFSALETLLLLERKRLSDADFGTKVGRILRNAAFHRALYAIACELICNQSGEMHFLPFAGFLQAVQATPFEVCKVLTNLIALYSSGSGGIMTAAPLSIIYHLRQCEDGLLESLAWRSDSAIFQLLSTGETAASSETADAQHSNGHESASVILGKGSSHALRMFFAHVLLLTEVRLKKLLSSLHAIALLEKCWSVMTHILAEQRGLVCDRHLDQLIMATVYAVAKVFNINGRQLVQDVTFHSIIREYAATFGAERTHVYRSVLVKPDRRGGAMYGDVIQFYNEIYMPQLKVFLMALGEAPKMATVSATATAPRESIAHLNTSIRQSPMRAVEGVSPPSATAQSRYMSHSPFSAAPAGVEMTPTTKVLYHFGGTAAEVSGALSQEQQQRRKRPAMNPLDFDADPDDSVLQRRMKRIAGVAGSGPLGLQMPE